MDPSQRMTCEELLNHQYFDRYEVYSETRRANNRGLGHRDRVSFKIQFQFLI